jgi:hypothetical protein
VPLNCDITQVAITLASSAAVQVLPRNESRIYLCVQNVGANDLQIGFSSTLASGLGVTLSPGGLGSQGGFFVWDSNGFVPTNPIYAVSAVGTTIVAWTA